METISRFNSDRSGLLFEHVVGRPENLLLNNEQLHGIFGNDRILIVGAAGSIGSSLARRLKSANVQNLFFLDNDESRLHELSLELSGSSAAHSDNYIIADIRDQESVENALEIAKPTVLLHAAALKHLSMIEKFPREAFLTNIIGTLNLVDKCIKKGIKQFVNISTDKAANPTSVLGKTKKLAELLVEESYADNNLAHCSVRFGNVFASRGSVIETFVHQINHQIPVTITDPNVSRFFMSQNEAANLVLASASLNEKGIFILDMGDEVRISDVVERIASFLNLPFSFSLIGLQKGEKLREELYDGPVTKTKFTSISKSVHKIKTGLIDDLRGELPIDNKQSLLILNKLVSKYLQNN